MLSALRNMSYVKLINIGDRQFFQGFSQTCFKGHPLNCHNLQLLSPPPKKKELFLNRMKDMIIISKHCMIIV